MSLDRYVVQVDPAEPVLQSWVSVDATGQKTVLDVDKYAIMHRVQIDASDLRILDPSFCYPSVIMGRERTIILNLEHIKMIITANEVLLRDPSHENVIPVLEELQRRLPVGQATHHGHENTEAETPFEFRALEVALEAFCILITARTNELEELARSALCQLFSKISGSYMEKVRKYKNDITQLIAGVQKVRDALEKLLDDEDDMADIYLSRKLAWVSPSPAIGSEIFRASRMIWNDEDDVEELEILLEAYFKKLVITSKELTMLRECIDEIEDYNNIELSNQRNQLIKADLVFKSVNVSLTVYSMIVGLFAMNIPFTWNKDRGYKFELVVSLTGAFCAVFFVIIVLYSRSKGLFDIVTA